MDQITLTACPRSWLCISSGRLGQPWPEGSSRATRSAVDAVGSVWTNTWSGEGWTQHTCGNTRAVTAPVHEVIPTRLLGRPGPAESGASGPGRALGGARRSWSSRGGFGSEHVRLVVESRLMLDVAVPPDA